MIKSTLINRVLLNVNLELVFFSSKYPILRRKYVVVTHNLMRQIEHFGDVRRIVLSN